MERIRMISLSASGGAGGHVRAMRITCTRAHLERSTRPMPETLARIDAAARGDELEQHFLDAAIASATAHGDPRRAARDRGRALGTPTL
ncbi:hypothetical protein BE11_48795 [Sorangium cellulosum]|nr:hypothetical protein BE11_48795 [Sorangium cellulosum]